MSFWNLSSGEALDTTETSFEQEGGSIEPIPNNTTVQAFVEEVKWDKFYQSEEEYINIRWRVTAPQAYANRVIFHKLAVLGNDPRAKDPAKKGDNAKRMLGAIDANCGGKLSRVHGKPTDIELQSALMNKALNAKVMLWEMKNDAGEVNKGNWIAAVSPRAAVQEPVVTPKKEVAFSHASSHDLDEEIPF